MCGKERGDAWPRDERDAMIVKESNGIKSHPIARGKEEHLAPLLAIEFSLAHGVVVNFGPVKTALCDHHDFPLLFGGGRGPRGNHHAVQILFKIKSSGAHKISVDLIWQDDGPPVLPMLVNGRCAPSSASQIAQRRRSPRQRAPK